MSEEKKQCSSCHIRTSNTSSMFKLKPNGKLSSTCVLCLEKKALKAKLKKKRVENIDTELLVASESTARKNSMLETTLNDFYVAVSNNNTNYCTYETSINSSTIDDVVIVNHEFGIKNRGIEFEELESIRLFITSKIFELTGYNFVTKSVKWGTANTKAFYLHCSQDLKSKRHRPGKRVRKIPNSPLKKFDCHSLLVITLNKITKVVKISFQHDGQHERAETLKRKDVFDT